MSTGLAAAIIVVLVLAALAASVRVLEQYERGVQFRLGRVKDVGAAIDQIAQTTLRAVVGRHTLDETLSETDTIDQNIREILDVQTEEWGVKVTTVELKDIQLPEGMQRAMARQAEAEREKRARIIAAEGEALAAGELGTFLARETAADEPVGEASVPGY